MSNKKTTFVNRKKDFEFVKSNILNNNSKNILFLYGYSGIGKSRFVEEMLNKSDNKYIKVIIPIMTNENNFSRYFFINALYNAIRNTTKSRKFYNYFTINSLGMGVQNFSIEIGLQNSSFYERYVIKQFKYIKKKLSKSKQEYIIDFHNFQNIDNESLELLKNIIQELSNNIIFIFEYTIFDANDNLKIRKMANEFIFLCNNDINCIIYELEKLHDTELEKILNEKGVSKDYFLTIKNEFNSSNGNLINLVLSNNDLLISNNCSHNDNFIIKKTILSLQHDEMILLYIICFCKGKISFKQLTEIYENDYLYSKKENIINILTELSTKLLIVINCDVISIAHDSIIKIIYELEKNDIIYISYKIVENYYSNLVDSETKILDLFYIYTLFNDKRILNIIPQLKKVIINQRYPKKILEQFSMISKLKSNFNYSQKQLNLINISEVEVLYITGYYDKAYEKLNEIYNPNNPIHVAYKGAIIALSNFKNGMIILDDLITKAKNNIRLVLTLKLHKLIYLMENKFSTESESFAKDLLSTKQYEKYIEYVFLLENYSEFQNNNEAINTLNYCIKKYKSFKREDLAERCKIALASRYAYIKKLKESKILLKKASNNILFSVKHDYILNNLAVINILNSDFSKKTEEMLLDALLINLNNYERQIIQANLLIVYTFNNKYNKAIEIVKKLENYLLEKPNCYEEIQHLTLLNLRYFYMSYKEDNMVEQINIELKNLTNKPISKELKDYINANLGNKEIKNINHQWYNYAKLNYRPDFVGYWQFEISSELDNYEYN